MLLSELVGGSRATSAVLASQRKAVTSSVLGFSRQCDSPEIPDVNTARMAGSIGKAFIVVSGERSIIVFHASIVHTHSADDRRAGGQAGGQAPVDLTGFVLMVVGSGFASQYRRISWALSGH